MTLKLVRIIARGICNRLTNFDASGTFRSRLMRMFVVRLHTKLELYRPSRSEDIAHLLCEH